jgi:lysozyme
MAIQGIDISAYQGSVNFSKVKNSGHGGFVYAKATEGISVKDDNFPMYHGQANSYAVPIGAYHFFHFQDDPIAQAEFFSGTIAGREGTLVPMVDVESSSMQGSGMSVREAIGRLGAFVDSIDSRLHGKRTLIYTGYSFWNDVMGGSDSFAGHPVWVAAYAPLTDPVPTPNGWAKTTIWQYTDSLQVDGIYGNVDGDVLLDATLLGIMRQTT